MSKGLKAFREIENCLSDLSCSVREEYIDIVYKELKDKEKFEELVNMDLDLFMKAVDIKGLIEDYQKFKKALEIIKKDINMSFFETKEDNTLGETHYIVSIGNVCAYQIPKEDYDLLKEVLL